MTADIKDFVSIFPIGNDWVDIYYRVAN